MSKDEAFEEWKHNYTMKMEEDYHARYWYDGETGWKLKDMHDRPVFVRPIGEDDITLEVYPKLAKCSDCGKPARFIICELDSHKWGYCGLCDVGG